MAPTLTAVDVPDGFHPRSIAIPYPRYTGGGTVQRGYGRARVPA